MVYLHTIISNKIQKLLNIHKVSDFQSVIQIIQFLLCVYYSDL